jgi:fumarate hydratase, class II
MTKLRKETDSLGVVEVPADKLWGAQTQRSLEHFSIGKDLIPREMITAYATLKKAAAIANHDGKRLDDERYKLVIQTCDEILAGKHHDMFPLHVWMTGSGTQFNMNVNEVISNRCSQIAGTPLGSHAPVHPNDHVNMAQSSNDSFPSAMCIAAAVNVKERLLPAVMALRDAIASKSKAWSDIVKIGRTHMQDATPLTLGQEWSGYAGMLSDNLERIEGALQGVYRWRSVAQQWGQVSTPRRTLPRRQQRRLPGSLACPSSPRRISSPCRARMTLWFSSPERCARSLLRSTRLPMTSA